MEPLQSRSSTAAAEAIDSRRLLWRTQIGLAVILDQNTPKRCPAASAFSNMAHPNSHLATLKVDSACDNTHHGIITLKLWDSLQNMSDPWPTHRSYSVACGLLPYVHSALVCHYPWWPCSNKLHLLLPSVLFLPSPAAQRAQNE